MTISSWPRVIPVLLISDGYLVKPQRFAKPTYIGDPMNAVKIFNEKEVDELVILDIDATRLGRAPDYTYIEDIVSEAFMPVGYGGGVADVRSAERLVALGVEKVVLGTALQTDPEAVRAIAQSLGAQSTVASIDVRRRFGGRPTVNVTNGRVSTGSDPVAWARRAQDLGVGEVVLSAIDREGTFSGYDLELVSSVAGAVEVPVVALGGARGLEDFAAALDAGASAVAAGSAFVLNGKHRAVLITYPRPDEIRSLAPGMSA